MCCVLCVCVCVCVFCLGHTSSNNTILFVCVCCDPPKNKTKQQQQQQHKNKYRRCTWVLMDIWDCNQSPTANLIDGDSFCLFIPSFDDPQAYETRITTARLSYVIGIVALIVGVFGMWMGYWVPFRQDHRITPIKAICRFCIVYCLGISCVNIWRAIW
jgi:MFS-type transporter involved in bile tolerance (Atg22 family)